MVRIAFPFNRLIRVLSDAYKIRVCAYGLRCRQKNIDEPLTSNMMKIAQPSTITVKRGNGFHIIESLSYWQVVPRAGRVSPTRASCDSAVAGALARPEQLVNAQYIRRLGAGCCVWASS
jgi:hypothetical protein